MDQPSDEQIDRAAKYTLMQMRPRIITLANAIQQMNRSLFPDDSEARCAADGAALDMSVMLLIITMVSKDKRLRVMQERMHEAVDNAFQFGQIAPADVLEQEPDFSEDEING